MGDRAGGGGGLSGVPKSSMTSFMDGSYVTGTSSIGAMAFTILVDPRHTETYNLHFMSKKIFC